MTKKHKAKFYAVTVAKLLGIFLGCLAFVWGMIEFMWICYYMGVPM